MSRTIRVTLFENLVATTKREIAIALDELAARILSTTALTKNRLPWLKLAVFGDKRTGKGSLRHDGNLLAISGAEADYDGGMVSFDAACEQLERAGIEAIVCTSPSHSEIQSRWRVLTPFSVELPPERREQMMGRLNGLLGGIFAPESWTLSQAYFFGSVNQNPLHRVKVISGTPLDLHDDLDGASIGRPGTIYRPKGGDSTGRHRVGSLDVDAMRRAIASGGSFHEACVRLLGRWAQEGVAFLDAQQRLLGLFDEVPPNNRDGRWQSRRNDVPRLVRDIYGKHARQFDNSASVAETAADGAPPSFRDPWEASPALEWPGGVFHDELNDLVYQFHFRDGVDAGAQGMAMLTTLSGAAPKKCTVRPI